MDIVLDQQMELSSMASDPTHPKFSIKVKRLLLCSKYYTNLERNPFPDKKSRFMLIGMRFGCVDFFSTKIEPYRLKMSFEVNFTGLTGEQSSMDVGALSYEFFGVLLREASLRPLEGKEENLVPKRSRGMSQIL